MASAFVAVSRSRKDTGRLLGGISWRTWEGSCSVGRRRNTQKRDGECIETLAPSTSGHPWFAGGARNLMQTSSTASRAIWLVCKRDILPKLSRRGGSV